MCSAVLRLSPLNAKITEGIVVIMPEPEHRSGPTHGDDESGAQGRDPSVARGQQPGQKPQQDDAATADVRGRLDQLGAILAKGLDLAEASVSLGVTIVSRVGAVAQQRIRERAAEVATQQGAVSAEQRAGQATGPGDWPSSEPSGSGPQAPQEPAYGITNRLPLIPGGTANISFSVNNDSLAEPKKVELRVDGFTGDVRGAHIDAANFAVKPNQKTIAPVDFEKFTLHCTVPAETQPDLYRGMIVVASESELRIPVMLVVTSL